MSVRLKTQPKQTNKQTNSVLYSLVNAKLYIINKNTSSCGKEILLYETLIQEHYSKSIKQEPKQPFPFTKTKLWQF